MDGVRVVPICRRDLSCSNRESRCKDELDEVDDFDSVDLSDPNRERVPNVDRVEDLL
jgi:hypothetical protein